MSYVVYKWIHYIALTLLIVGLTGVADTAMLKDQKTAKLPLFLHGFGLLLLLISGFGLAARLGIFTELPTWLILKLVLWLLIGALVVLVRRKAVLGLTLSLVILSGIYYLAVFKL